MACWREGTADAFAQFEAQRRADCEAIATMALENYAEMRDSVRDPRFQRQKELAMALERACAGPVHPALFDGDVPRRDPATRMALERGRIQQRILDELTTTVAAPDLQVAAELISQRLPPLSAAAR